MAPQNANNFKSTVISLTGPNFVLVIFSRFLYTFPQLKAEKVAKSSAILWRFCGIYRNVANVASFVRFAMNLNNLKQNFNENSGTNAEIHNKFENHVGF